MKISGFIAILMYVICVGQTIASTDKLRKQYNKHPKYWPKAQTTDGRIPLEMSPLPGINPNLDARLVSLGEKLFHDPILSKDGSVSCASCHEKRLLFSDKRPKAVGIRMQVGKRNTPAIFGVEQWKSFFWDGRAKTIEQQVLMPIKDPKEMDLPIKEAVRRLNKDKAYKTLFASAFSKRSVRKKQALYTNKITKKQLALAIATFERSIKPPTSAFTKFIALAYQEPQKATSLLSDKELAGLHLYRTKAKCMTCHEGALLSDNKFHVTGLHFYSRRFQDLGRYEHTKDPKDSGKFRTPSLIGLNQTSPWMHNGLFTNLQGIINLYNAGGIRPRPRKQFINDPLFPKTTELLQPLELTAQEKQQLLAFLKML